MGTTTHVKPDAGDTKFVLYPPGRKGGKFRLEERIWVEKGHTTFFDDDALDWVSWPGQWITLRIIDRFKSMEDAKDYMLKHLADEIRATSKPEANASSQESSHE